MIVKAFVGGINMVPSKDGPRFRMTFATASLPADVFGMLCTFAGKNVTLEIVPGDEQLEMFTSVNAARDSDPGDGGDPPDAPEGGDEPNDSPASGSDGGWTPPGWRE